MKALIAAIAFLTRIPIASRIELAVEDVKRSMLFFPLVGALIGLTGFAAYYLLIKILPHNVALVLVLALLALMTGALHLDGLADTFDGFGGGRTKADVLRIMRDHQIGSYGALALIFVVLAKYAALVNMNAAQIGIYLIIAPSLGRWSAVLLAYFLPYARQEGMASAFVKQVRWVELLGATAFALTICMYLAGTRGAICLAVVAALTTITGLYFHRRIGGVTGDTIGSNVELSEVMVLLSGLILK